MIKIKGKIFFSIIISFAFFLSYAKADNLSHIHYKEDFQILASIKPVQMLVQSVVLDIAQVKLLVPENVSVHDYRLKFSDLRKISKSKAVFSIDPKLETSLTKALQLNNIPSVYLFKMIFLKKSHRTSLDISAKKQPHNLINYHIWLEPSYAEVMIDSIEAQLSKIYPKYKSSFKENAKNAKEKINQLDLKISNILSSVKKKPFLVFHDAYQYFVEHYGLNQINYISDVNANISAKKIIKLRKEMDHYKISCVFSEKQFYQANKLIKTIAQNRSYKIETLNPIGDAHTYPELLSHIAQKFKSCLLAS